MHLWNSVFCWKNGGWNICHTSVYNDKFTSALQAFRKITCRLEIKFVQGVRRCRVPELMKASWEFMNLSSWPLPNNWLTWYDWCILEFLPPEFQREIAKWNALLQRPCACAAYRRWKAVTTKYIPCTERAIGNLYRLSFECHHWRQQMVLQDLQILKSSQCDGSVKRH